MSGMTRRDVLAAFLGAPLAAAACSRRKRVPDGELAFRPDELGHRLRDAPPPEVPASKWERVGVVIVGGGVAGLSAAYRLAQAGYHDFVLVELDDAPGGTSRSGANRTSAYPWGAHYITAPMKYNRDLVALLTSFGAVEGTSTDGEPIFREELLCREPQERLFADGVWHEGLVFTKGASASELEQLRRFQGEMGAFAAMRDRRGRRAFAVPIAHGGDFPELEELDKITMSEWLTQRGYSSERLSWLVDYACKDDFGARASQTSAWAAIHYHASRLRGPKSDGQPVLTWPEGNGWLVARLLGGGVKAKVRSGLAAVDVRPREGGVDVVAIGPPPTCVGLRAERVIFAAPQFVAQRVVAPLREAPPAHASAFAYGAWMVANITLSDRPKRTPGVRTMAWDNVLYDSPGLGYVDATHQRGRDHGPTVITYYYPLCDDDPRAARQRLHAASRDEWADVALADLERAHRDIRALATRVDVVRWGHAMMRPSPGTFSSGVLAAAAKPLRGVHFAHTDLSGVSLFEEAFYHGTRAANEALDALRRGEPPT